MASATGRENHDLPPLLATGAGALAGRSVSRRAVGSEGMGKSKLRWQRDGQFVRRSPPLGPVAAIP